MKLRQEKMKYREEEKEVKMKRRREEGGNCQQYETRQVNRSHIHAMNAHSM